MKKTIILLGDLHAPFVHKPSISKALELISDIPGRGRRGKSLVVVQCGDALDCLSFSRFPRKIINSQDEITEGMMCLQELWKAIDNRAPDSKRFMLKGNHDQRIHKKIMDKIPELDGLIDLSHLWKVDGVETIDDVKEPLIIDDWLLTHGHLTGRPGQHLKHFQYSHNVAFGHTHRAFNHYERLAGGKILSEANIGYLADPFDRSGAFSYRPMNKFFTWSHGVEVIDQGVARFIPFAGS